jgi:hypothetical protein
MAYMSQEKKAKIAPVVKAVLKKYKVKGSLAVRNHSTLVLNIKSGAIDFIENFIATDRNALSEEQVRYIRANKSLDVNPYWYHEHFDGKAKKFLTEIMAAMNDGNHDRSDAQVDYFDVGWYVDVNIGNWKKHYEVVV